MAGNQRKISKEFTLVQKILIVLLASLLLSALCWLYSFTLSSQYDVSLSFALSGYDSDSHVVSPEQIVTNLYSEAVLLEHQPNINAQDERKMISNHELPILKWDHNKRVASLHSAGSQPDEIAGRMLTALDLMEQLVERDNKLKIKQNEDQILALNNKITELMQPKNFGGPSELGRQNRIGLSDESNIYISQALFDVQLRSAQTTATINLLKKDAKDRNAYLAIPYIAGDEDLRGLITSRSLLSQQLAHLEAQLSSKSPQVRAMKAEYNNLNQQIDQKISVLVKEIYNQSFIDKQVETLLVDKLSKKPLVSTKRQEAQQASSNEQLPSTNELPSLIKRRDKIADENLALMTNPPRLNIIQPLTSTQRQLQIGRNYVFLPFIIGLIVFSTLVTLLSRLSKKPAKSYLQRQPAVSKTTTPHKIQVRSETIAELYSQIQAGRARRVAVFGNQAENFAARIAIDFSKSGAKIILVDFSGSELKRYIGHNEGLTDILFGSAHLDDVIYKDSNSGVDILSKGLAVSTDHNGLAEKMANLVAQLEERYSLVVLAVSEEPFAPLHGFLNKHTLLVITKARENNSENDLWIDTLGLAGFSRVILMKE